jgi:hypothetical protein
MPIELSSIIETAMQDPDTSDLNKTLEDAWAPYIGRTPEDGKRDNNPMWELYFETEIAFMDKACRYMKAGFLAGYKLGSDPAAFVKSCMAVSNE